jgi:hypothetical protein
LRSDAHLRSAVRSGWLILNRMRLPRVCVTSPSCSSQCLAGSVNKNIDGGVR